MLPFLAFPLSFALTGLADDTANMKLGGLRQASALIRISESHYQITVRMLPVLCFDDATNRHMNRGKARQQALQALSLHLNKDKRSEMSVSEVQVQSDGMDGTFYTMTVQVPRSGVEIASVSKNPANGKERVPFTSALFTRKFEYAATVKQFVEKTLNDLSEQTKATGFDALQQKVARNFDSLGHEIKSDLLLLSVEQAELLGAIAEQRGRVISAVQAARRLLEAKEKTK